MCHALVPAQALRLRGDALGMGVFTGVEGRRAARLSHMGREGAGIMDHCVYCTLYRACVRACVRAGLSRQVSGHAWE